MGEYHREKRADLREAASGEDPTTHDGHELEDLDLEPFEGIEKADRPDVWEEIFDGLGDGMVAKRARTDVMPDGPETDTPGMWTREEIREMREESKASEKSLLLEIRDKLAALEQHDRGDSDEPVIKTDETTDRVAKAAEILADHTPEGHTANDVLAELEDVAKGGDRATLASARTVRTIDAMKASLED